MAVLNNWGLPVELWGKVFSFVPKQDLLAIKLVCRIFKKVATDFLRLVFGPKGTTLPWESNQVQWNGDVSQIVTYLREKVKNRKTYELFFLETVCFLIRIGYPLNVLDGVIGCVNFEQSLGHLGKDLPLAVDYYGDVLTKLKDFRSDRTQTISIVAHYVGILYLVHDCSELAKACFYFAHHNLKKARGDQRLHAAAILRNIGKALFNEGLPQHQFLQPFRESLPILESALGKVHVEVAYCLRDIGEVCCEENQYLAKRTLARAVAIFKKVYGEVDLDVAYCLLCLGEVSHANIRYSYFTESLQILKTLYENNEHLDFARVLEGLMARTLERLTVHFQINRRYSQALEYGVQALAFNFKLFGKDHLKVAQNLEALTELYRRTEDYSEAIKHGLVASEIFMKDPDESQYDLANVFFHTGMAYFGLRDIPNAVEYLSRAIAIYQRNDDTSSVDFVQGFINMILRR